MYSICLYVLMYVLHSVLHNVFYYVKVENFYEFIWAPNDDNAEKQDLKCSLFYNLKHILLL